MSNLQMTDEEIIQGILEGCSLRTFMVPDPAMPNNHPEHMESFDLPHVIINGNKFWAKSETAHLTHTVGSNALGNGAYCYTNLGNLYCSYDPQYSIIVAFRKTRYNKHNWILNNNYNLIWEFDENQTTDIVRREIELGSKFKIAMLDTEDIWNVHTVDLPMYELETGLFKLNTALDFYPLLFRYQNSVEHLAGLFKEIVERKPEWIGQTIGGRRIEDEREVTTQIEAQSFSTFYSLYSDGTYYNYFDIPRSTTQKYKHLKIFTDNI